MKRFPRVFCAGVCAISLLLWTFRAETLAAPVNPESANAIPREDLGEVLVVFEAYAVGREEGRETLETKPGSAGRYQKVLDLERNGKARLEILTAVTTKPSQRAIAEACDEMHYATEFAPGKSRDDAPVATAFEVRNVGDTFEIEPSLDADGAHCSVNLVPQRVSLAGFRDIPGNADDPPGAQPIFATQKLTTSSKVALDQVHFLGTFSPSPGKARASGESAPEIWFAFLNVHRVYSERKVQKPRPFNGSSVELEYSFYSLDRAAARDLLSSPPKLATPWEGLQDLLRENKARFERLQSIKTMSGQRAVSEESGETRIGSEYALPGVRRSRETTTRTVTPVASDASPEPGKNGAKPAQRLPPGTSEKTTVEREIPNSEGSPGAFTAFETRKTGAIVEAEPAVGPDGAIVDVNNVVQSELDLGSLETNEAAVAFPAQPVFEVRKLSTSVTTLMGGHTLVGTLSMPGANGVNGRVDDGRTWLVFLRVMPDSQ